MCSSKSNSKRDHSDHNKGAHDHEHDPDPNLQRQLESLKLNNWDDRLKPHLFIDTFNSDGEKHIRLFIFFKKDSHNQKITIKQNDVPVAGENTRKITLNADHSLKPEGDYYYRGKIEIPYSKKGPDEDRILVHIDHDHSHHGGTGTIHWP